jgi:hypothetical protein
MGARPKSFSWFCSLVAAVFLGGVPKAEAFSYVSPLSLFPEGPIVMDYQLGLVNGTLIDGSTSWDEVVQRAAGAWNNYISLATFTRYASSPKAPAANDGVNQVYWDDSVNGVPFGNFTLAVTVRWTLDNVCTEADVVFDVEKSWNSYRGPLRSANDIYRVGLHELGHVLGLSHPDDHGQDVSAVMNSVISNLDHLSADDIAGARSLYFGLAPSITQQPASQTVIVGGTAEFSVQASGEPAPLYQWYRDNQLLPGATNSTLTVSDAQLSDTGAVRVRAKNSHGTAWSDTAMLKVLAPPAIVAPPASRIIRAGAPVTFSATITGTRPFTFEWLHNGSVISNGVSSRYTFTPRLASDAGEYAVKVMNAVGADTSSAAQLAVVFPPRVTSDLGSNAVLEGASATLTATVEGSGSFSYQWLFKGARIDGATGAELALNDVTRFSAGTYAVEVRNETGTARSAPVRLQVIIPPAITIPPMAVTARAGERAVFRVRATGTKPLLYQWMKDGVPIPGAVQRSFVIPQAQASDAANYSVRVSNAGGAIESIPVALSVLE